MRVLYLIERFWPYIGGVEVMAARTLPLLRDRGLEFVIVTSRDDAGLPETAEFRGIPVHRMPLIEALLSNDPELIIETRRRLENVCREVAPDLLHVVFTGPSIYYADALRQSLGVPTLLSFHGSWPERTVDGFLARSLSNAAWVTACSESALADLRAMSPGVADRSSTILNGLDPPPTAPTPPRFDPPVLLCAARIEPEKGFDIALRALVRVLDDHPTTRLLIVGDGRQRPALEQLAAALGIEDSVDFLGWVSPDAMHSILDRASIVLVPSRIEGFGLIALEAALMARPVVASDVGGLPEVLGRDGLLVPAEDSTALALAILRLLSNPGAAQEEGERLQAMAKREFTATRHADEYEQLYLRLAGEERSVAV